MKLRGKSLDQRREMTVVLTREGNEDIVLKMAAVLNTSDFDKVYQEPSPPTKILKGGAKTLDFDNETYKSAIRERNKSYIGWLIFHSLSVTEGLEWDIVKMDDPNTWNQWQDELEAAKFSAGEIKHILAKVIEVNGMSEERLEEARQAFLLRQQMGL
jgi:hypothetical protein